MELSPISTARLCDSLAFENSTNSNSNDGNNGNGNDQAGTVFDQSDAATSFFEGLQTYANEHNSPAETQEGSWD
ncbi:hypothetical protein BK809_0002897 [Diplodia seriata]|uniref:Uncharacterized protein n=1 Tax=Diplodia seriata TaxID=420778 RepID=A0A1S8BKR3_9PEZI|nr:hypothetical protein BK809_0002897 [Diplodia seriata]